MGLQNFPRGEGGLWPDKRSYYSYQTILGKLNEHMQKRVELGELSENVVLFIYVIVYLYLLLSLPITLSIIYILYFYIKLFILFFLYSKKILKI